MPGAIPPASWPAEKRAICLEIPDTVQWVALVTGIIQQLSFGYYWDKNYSNWEDAKQAGQEILLSWMKQIRCDAGAVPIEEPQCVDYPNDAPLLDWQPMNPFLNPGNIPPGYVAAPWGVVGDPPVFPYQAGDVISGLFGLPVLTPALGQGLARVRVKFTGKGTVEIHFIKVALGGIALYTWDDNPLTAKFVDTSMDFLALPPETGDEDIQEIEFTTDGPHHIDITMLPRFGAEVGFAGYGGGIRKIVLCGPDLQYVDRPGQDFIIEDGFENPEDGGQPMALCESLRWNNGTLQAWCCGEWQDVPGGSGGLPGNPTQPPPASPPATDECITYHVSLNGRDQWLLPFPVQEGYKLRVENARGGWNDGTLGWFCPSGKVYEFGACAADQPAEGGDPMPDRNHMSIVGFSTYDTTWFNPMSGDYTFPAGVTDSPVTLQANDGSLSDNQGSIEFDVIICATSLPVFSHTFNFVISEMGWQPVLDGSDPRATYNAGNGWDENPSHVPSRLSIYIPAFSPRKITATSLENSVALGGNLLFQSIYYGTEEFDITAAGPHMEWPGSTAECSTIRIDLSNDSNPNGRTMDGYVQSVTVTGEGTDPFLP